MTISFHVKSPAIVPTTDQTAAWRTYLDGAKHLTQHILRMVDPKLGEHSRTVLEVPSGSATLVEERILSPHLGVSGDIQRNSSRLKMQPNWTATALVLPTASATPLDAGMLVETIGCLSIRWRGGRCVAMLHYDPSAATMVYDEVAVISRLIAAGWTVRPLNPRLARVAWMVHPGVQTSVLPVLTAQELPNPQGAVSTPPAVITSAPAAPAATRTTALQIDHTPVLATDDEPGLLVGVNTLGEAVRLAWRSMTVGVTGPDDHVRTFLRTMLQRGLDWGQRDGCGILAVLPPAYGQLVREPWASRLRILDPSDLHQSISLPLAIIPSQTLTSLFQRYGFPRSVLVPTDLTLGSVLQQCAPHLATPGFVGLTAPPGDDLAQTLIANGGIVVLGDTSPDQRLIVDLLWAVVEASRVENTPLIVTHGSVTPPAALAARALVFQLTPAGATNATIRWDGNRWELLDTQGKRITIIDADLQSAPTNAAAPEHDDLHTILGSGYGSSPTLVPADLPVQTDDAIAAMLRSLAPNAAAPMPDHALHTDFNLDRDDGALPPAPSEDPMPHDTETDDQPAVRARRPRGPLTRRPLREPAVDAAPPAIEAAPAVEFIPEAAAPVAAPTAAPKATPPAPPRAAVHPYTQNGVVPGDDALFMDDDDMFDDDDPEEEEVVDDEDVFADAESSDDDAAAAEDAFPPSDDAAAPGQWMVVLPTLPVSPLIPEDTDPAAYAAITAALAQRVAAESQRVGDPEGWWQQQRLIADAGVVVAYYQVTSPADQPEALGHEVEEENVPHEDASVDAPGDESEPEGGAFGNEWDIPVEPAKRKPGRPRTKQ